MRTSFSLRRDKARAVVASPALKGLEVQVGRTAFLDDNDVDLSIELPGFAKKMDGEKRAGRSTADDGDAITVQETRRWNWNFHFACQTMRGYMPDCSTCNLFRMASSGCGSVCPHDVMRSFGAAETLFRPCDSGGVYTVERYARVPTAFLLHT